MTVHREIAFEDAIERAMREAGWRQGQPANYRRELGLDTAMLMEFFGATQVEQWNRLVAYSGGDPDTAQRAFAERLAKEIDERGAVDVLRHGVKDRGLLFRLAYFRPAHTLADDALVQYEENRLSVTRQLHYSTKEPDRSLDLVLFVNGIPVATAELKNPLTGQTVEHAKEQYRRDRDPRSCSSPAARWSISRSTRSWSSSRRDSPGRRPGSCRSTPGRTARGSTVAPGNPPAGDAGYRTSYLWERVWQPERLARRHPAVPARRERRGRRAPEVRARQADDLPAVPPVARRPRR